MKNLFDNLSMGSLSLALILTLAISAHAQNDPLGPLMSVTEFTIKPGHDLQFQEGVKAWKECYIAAKGEWTWRMWQRQQGDGNVYVLATDIPNWAEMDKTDPVSKNCATIAINLINPHIEKSTEHVTRLLPALSKNTPTANELISVTFFELTQSHGYLFLPAVREVMASIVKAEGSSRGYWYSWMTYGPESPNYHIVVPYENYAAMDIMRDGPWEVYEKEHGKEKRDALQASFGSSLKNTWVYHFKLNVDMSRQTK